MKNRISIQLVAFAAIISVLGAGCATSYQDRADALNQPDGGTVETPPDTGDTISRDDIPLSGACIVNADCNSTQFCELGVCVTQCSSEQPCPDGEFCSARGKCVDDKTYVDTDPAIKATPPTSWSIDQRVVRLDPGVNKQSFNVNVDGGGVLQYRVQVEPQEAADAVILSEDEGTIASGGAKNISVSVDRSAFGDGDHRISVGVISDGGQQSIIYEFSNGITGRYGGFVDYTDPGLGRVPLVIEIDVDDNNHVTGRIVAEGSLLFPNERTLVGFYNKSQNMLYFETADRYDVNDIYDPFERNVGREVYFYGEISEQRVVKGTFEELIVGLLPQSMDVTGQFYLTRVDTGIADIVPVANPDLSSAVFEVPTTTFETCAGAPAQCDVYAGEFAADMISCSQALRSTAFQLGSAFVGVDGAGDTIVDFGLVEACEADVSNQGTGACVDIDDMDCLHNDQQHFLLDVMGQNSEFREYFTDLTGLQRLYAFMGNDLLKDAYRTAVEQVSSPLMQELTNLENALEDYEQAERMFFETGNIAVVGRASSNVVSENNFELFRIPLQYIRSSHAALARIASLTMRKDAAWPDRRVQLRERIQHHARVIFLEGVLLARLVSLHGGAFEYELAQIADELHSVGMTASSLEAGLNPLGFPVDYVPFIYDPAQSQYPTNFAQLSNMANDTVASALQKAQLADQSVEVMEMRTDEVEQRIVEIEQSFETEIQQICGINSFTLLEECGQGGGEIAIVYNQIEQQYLEIEKLYQQITDVHQMVKLKRDTALRIANIRENTLLFTQTSGMRLEALDIAEGQIRAAMLRRQGLFSSIGGFFSGLASLGGGIASAFISEGITGIGGIAGGVSGMVSAGLGAAASAQSAGAALKLARVSQQRTEIRNMQQLRLQEDQMAIEAIHAAETVKMLLIQMAQLNLDLELAEIRLDEVVIRANTMLQKVDMLLHQREVLVVQALESSSNPLSNLSFRLKRDHAVLLATNEFEKALDDVYLAARGLEHELNVDLPQIESQLFQAGSAQQLQDFLTCLDGWYYDYAIAFGSPHQEVAQISLREDILGFNEAITDEVTGEVIQPEELFRRVLLDPKHITQSGRVEFPFVTSIAGSTKQFSTLVCNDRVKNVRVMLVGDFLGDNEATVMLRQEGNSYLRDCSADPSTGEDVLNTYHLDNRNALIQTGVNDFGLAQSSYELAGRSVASDRWVLVIPTGSEAPNNADVDFLNIDDVVIEVTHDARTLNSGTPTSVFSQCNI